MNYEWLIKNAQQSFERAHPLIEVVDVDLLCFVVRPCFWFLWHLYTLIKAPGSAVRLINISIIIVAERVFLRSCDVLDWHFFVILILIIFNVKPSPVFPAGCRADKGTIGHLLE